MAAIPSVRFDPDIAAVAETVGYFERRAVQMLHDDADWTWSGVVTPLVRDGAVWGSETVMHGAGGAPFVSVYVLAGHRGRGHLRRHAGARPAGQRYVTTPGCEIYDVLARLAPDTLLAAPISGSPAYRAIERRYGDVRAERSGVFYMNHIDEGLRVLHRWLGASVAAQQAWCLHPLVQGDEDLRRSHDEGALAGFSPAIVTLALEYRNIANAFLSRMEDHPGFADAGRITRSPLAEVDAMLVADKVQNCKDFRRWHGTSHPRAARLERYFLQWLAALGRAPDEVDRLDRETAIPAGRLGEPREV